ncbi:hypothetical protein THAOC_09181 [Thalassiosira oceanica]|uniref:Uncharacterized protein n=1 Tax=Thalassiosira oceanica TaxID=159749 RepID=K0SX73_THAOC|nr:hypothetical protein THAOC_09181 [Thalassiosira oceanica]|eukprot:EJK69549.1 hypothetical protein THAOC_09181 [Thalassiosira oceanica]
MFEDELKKLQNEVEKLQTKLAEDGDIDPETLIELEKLKNTLQMFENELLKGEDGKIDVQGEDQTEDEGQTSKIDAEDEDQTSTVESSKPAAGSSTPETVGSEAPAVESPATISVSDPTADETVDVESPTLTTTVAQEEVLSSTPTTFNVTTTTAPANEQSAITTAQTSSTAISTQVTSITTTSSALQTPAPVPQTVNDWDHADHSCLTLELKQNGNALESGSSSEMTITYDYDLRTIMPLDGETLSSFENYIASDVAMNSCFLRRHLVEHSKKLLRGNRRSTSLIVRGFSSNPVDTNLDDQYECTIPSEESTSVCTPMRGQMTVFFDVFAEVCDQDALQKVSDELESEVLFQIQEGMESDTYTEASDNIVETVYIGPRQRGTVQSTSRRLVTCSLSPNEYTDASESAIVKPPSEGNSSSNLLYIVTTVICVSVILALLLAFLAIRRSRRRKQLFSRGPEIDKNQPDSPKTQAPMIVEIPQPIDDYEQQLLPSPVKLDMRSICSDESSSASALTESHEYKERASRYGDLYGGSYGDGGMELLQNISNLSSKEDQIFDKVSSMLANGRDEADPGGKVSHIAAIGAMSKLVTEGSHDDSRVSDDLMPGFSSSPQNSYQSIDKVDSQASENFDYSMVANSNDDEEGRESPNVSPMPSIEEESVGEEK